MLAITYPSPGDTRPCSAIRLATLENFSKFLTIARFDPTLVSMWILYLLPLMTLAVGLPLAHWAMRPRRTRVDPPSRGRTRVVLNSQFDGEPVRRGLYQ